MISFLSGKKTYILGFLGLLTIGGYFLGFESIDTANMLLGLFGFGGIISLRAAVAKI